jgi:AraC-like DNA-binding protein
MISDATTLLLDVFETVPHVMVCVKDRSGRYTAANEAFVSRTNRRRTTDVIGRRAGDLFPNGMATSYEAQDESVFQTGVAVRNQLEVITDKAGVPGWFLTTKLLVVGANGATEVVVVSVPAQLSRVAVGHADGLRAAVEFVHRNIGTPIAVRDVAAVAGMTHDQLERAMRAVLGTSPKQFVLRVRAEQAAIMIAAGGTTLAEVAAECGYYDQSQLNRQFTSIIGITPGKYRKLSMGI